MVEAKVARNWVQPEGKSQNLLKTSQLYLHRSQRMDQQFHHLRQLHLVLQLIL